MDYSEPGDVFETRCPECNHYVSASTEGAMKDAAKDHREWHRDKPLVEALQEMNVNPRRKRLNA